MRKRVSLQRSITLSILSIGLLSGAFGLAYAYWETKHSFREAIGLGFQELARQSADKVGLILEKEIEWVERLSSLPEVREAVREGTRLTFDQPVLERWKESQRPYFRSLVILDRRGRSIGGVTSENTRTYYSRQPWWPVVLEQRRSWVGKLRFDEMGHGYVEVAVPIVDEAGAVLGVLNAVIEKDQLLTSVLRSRIGGTGHAMLVGPQGRVLACPLLPPGRHTALIGPLRDSLASGLSLPEAAWMEVQDDPMVKEAESSGSHPWRSDQASSRRKRGPFSSAKIPTKPMRRCVYSCGSSRRSACWPSPWSHCFDGASVAALCSQSTRWSSECSS